jgi:hypothetical protein
MIDKLVKNFEADLKEMKNKLLEAAKKVKS